MESELCGNWASTGPTELHPNTPSRPAMLFNDGSTRKDRIDLSQALHAPPHHIAAGMCTSSCEVVSLGWCSLTCLYCHQLLTSWPPHSHQMRLKFDLTNADLVVTQGSLVPFDPHVARMACWLAQFWGPLPWAFSPLQLHGLLLRLWLCFRVFHTLCI